jgi:hypothetical protein
MRERGRRHDVDSGRLQLAVALIGILGYCSFLVFLVVRLAGT